MKNTVTLKLTWAEALAVDELVNTSAEKFFCVVGGDKDYSMMGWDKETADKCVRQAARRGARATVRRSLGRIPYHDCLEDAAHEHPCSAPP